MAPPGVRLRQAHDEGRVRRHRRVALRRRDQRHAGRARTAARTLTDAQQRREPRRGPRRLAARTPTTSATRCVNGFYQGWDLHPAQLADPLRRGLRASSSRASRRPPSGCANFVDKAAQATLVGDVFDDAATGQGLLNYFLRGIACGAITEEEALATGLTLDELRSQSFVKIMNGAPRAGLIARRSAPRAPPTRGLVCSGRVSDLAQAIAIAAFAVLIGIEWYVERVRARRLGRRTGYPFHDSITNLSIGLGSVLFGGIAVLQGVTVHAYLDEHAALVTLPRDSVWAWIGITLAVDFCFYWSHRAMHRVNLLWTIHAPHHQSDQYNFLVALRVAWGSVFFSWIFYAPLALLGVTIAVTLLSRGLSSLYQFLLHTRLVGKLGVLEYILNTPSHHRVHHGKDARYLDKNYGGILIIWDRMFGTFAAEDEEPTYGTTRPFDSFDPVWSNAVEWVRLARMTRATRRLRDKVQLWLRPPAWRPANLAAAGDGPAEASAAATAAPRAGRAPVPRPIDVYIAVNFVLVLGAAMLSMLYGDRVTAGGSVLVAAELLAAFVVWGALIEARRWAFWLEWARLGSLAALAVAFGASAAGLLVLGLALAAVAGLGAWSARLAAIA